MRSDAANLLSRLGQGKFKYQEFRDNFADMELWPLFEALIRDPRISGTDEDSRSLFTDDPAQGRDTGTPTIPHAEPVRVAGLFGGYGAQASASPPATAPRRPQDDVRSLLKRLNDQVAAGEL
ncbi:hypothetical protein Y88_1854 [Novosphingobium nitrogenifigens DSM 19370]|uniref:Uncharacterized protein n=1 Tax=Novosphingobium nitrogenifigens DSM 19370 TaxID=983920 RepID=F1Z4Y9_9SPHN|nr:hypothetical protein [Novosphingobium nitrogenifigens]EGD59980.1 hypothetical protein Y88_1854 [Novosphingobium nitrogenifigens DSM 19370]